MKDALQKGMLRYALHDYIRRGYFTALCMTVKGSLSNFNSHP